MKSLREIKAIGYSDAQEQCFESRDYSAPDGGWDSWLINGIGLNATCELFGCDPARNQDGWTKSMEKALSAYHRGACAGAKAARKAIEVERQHTARPII